MQKTEHNAQLLHPSLAGKGICLMLSLMVLAALSVRAGEPVMTLAMNQPTGKKFPLLTAYSSSNTNSSLPTAKSGQPPAASPKNENVTALMPDLPLQNQPNSVQRESLLIVQQSLAHSSKTMTVQAGYGQLWNEKSTLQKISTGYQEPGCAYVSANFSF